MRLAIGGQVENWPLTRLTGFSGLTRLPTGFFNEAGFHA
jgi:hypothetical protein